MTDKHLVTRPAAVFSALTVVSRILGLFRDMLAAAIFGASVSWDAFVVAYTFPNMFRRIFGEGALSSAFVPVFNEYMHHKGKDEAWRIANIVVSIVTFILLVLSVVVVCGLFLAEWIFPLSDRTRLIVELSQIMFPFVVFICLVGLFMGILNTFHHLAVPAFAPALFNIVLIIGILSTRFMRAEWQMPALAFVVLIGGFLELVMHFPILKSKGMHYKIIFDWKHPAVRKIFFLMLPMILGFSITQINIVMDRMLALWLGPGAVSTLYFGDRLMELPVGIFGVALGVASLSVMSKQAVRKDLEALKETLNYSLRIIFFISLPVTVGLIVLRYPIVSVLFEREAFTRTAAIACSRVVLCYGLGMIAYLSLKVITQCFYSLQDTKTPVKVGTVMVVLNFILNVILMTFIREAGLALATAICATLNMCILLMLLSKKLAGIKLWELMHSFLRNALSALLMGSVCWILMAKVWPINKNIFILLANIGIGVLVYFLTSVMFKAKEVKELCIHFCKPK
jgi:putative peptidoglycan lipid II flippase